MLVADDLGIDAGRYADLFTAAGERPDADLNQEGYLGRIKSLPVFTSTEFPDTHVLVGNRELLMYRVFQPMRLEGPIQAVDGEGSILPSQQWYIEQFDGWISPVPGKGSAVKIA